MSPGRLSSDPRVRRMLISLYRLQAGMRGRGEGPRVLANGMPKSGTHLLSSLLSNMPGLYFSGRHYSLGDFSRPTPQPGAQDGVDWRRVKRTLTAVKPGQFMTAHFPADPRLLELLEELGYRTLVIFRDPRDTVVSNAFYIAREQHHWLHDEFVSAFPSTEDRIMACITGLPSTPHRKGLESIGGRMGRQLPWLDDPSTLVCRFEDLVGSSGGGDDASQRGLVQAVGRHLNRDLTDDQIASVARDTWSQESPTFRKGVSGDWKNHFTEEHKRAFKDAAGEYLVALGYEKNGNW
jgi:Sulfotransferase domain